MIDLHSHILPGVDDGVRSVGEAVELARVAAAAGVSAIAATPHVRADYPTSPELMENGVVELRQRLADTGIALEILPGGEVDLMWMSQLGDDDLLRFSLAGSGRYVLVEVPDVWTRGLDAVGVSLAALSLVPVYAHPERNRAVQQRPERLRALLEGGGVVQVTTASLDGRLGRSAQKTAIRLLDLGLVHLLASDAHAPGSREFCLDAALGQVADDTLAHYLIEDAPAAVVAGAAVPTPPPRRRTRQRIFRV